MVDRILNSEERKIVNFVSYGATTSLRREPLTQPDNLILREYPRYAALLDGKLVVFSTRESDALTEFRERIPSLNLVKKQVMRVGNIEAEERAVRAGSKSRGNPIGVIIEGEGPNHQPVTTLIISEGISPRKALEEIKEGARRQAQAAALILV